MNSKWPTNWDLLFPGLALMAYPELQSFPLQLRPVTIAAATTVFFPGAACDNFLLLTRGNVKVTLTASNGREVVLYRVKPGETCILTTSCLLSHEHYPALGTTESEVEAMLMPPNLFRLYLTESGAFQNFVFASLGQRFSDLIQRIENVSFHSVDSRLADVLVAQADASGCVHLTHQVLAVEMGSAREVVSRRLKYFETQGWIKIERGAIQLLNQQALVALCS